MSENPSAAPLRGKLTRLPLAIREMLCERLQNGDPGRIILPWINALPGVVEFLAAEYNGDAVNEANLSAFRQGYYQKWLKQRDGDQRTRALAERAAKRAQADGGTIAAGAASIVAGCLMEIAEEIDAASEEDGVPKMDPDTAIKLAAAIDKMRKGDQADVKLAQDQKKIKQKDEEIRLAREAFDQKLKEYQDKIAAQKREIESALGTVKAGGLTPETLKQLEESVRLL